MDELTNAISKSRDTAVGPDSIHYQLLKNLPDSAVDTLLGVINYIWTTGDFPPEWHLATVIPVVKPGKDSTDPTIYRPIASSKYDLEHICLPCLIRKWVYLKAASFQLHCLH